ncbi:MAG: YdcF family protein [Cyanobacteria bacterium P01_A01_bin.123]
MAKRVGNSVLRIKRWCQLSWRRRLILIGIVGAGATLSFAGLIAVRLALARQQNPEPQAILILDGPDYRVRQAAKFAQQYPDLPIWVSGNCSQRSGVRKAFATAQVSTRVRYDVQATDTVTHFTTLADDFTAQEIRHVYVITSDYHMARVKTVATLIFGSRGIAIAPVAQPSQYRPSDESWLKVIRDGLRALVWLVTGHNGARFNPRLTAEATCGLQAGRRSRDGFLSARSPGVSPQD